MTSRHKSIKNKITAEGNCSQNFHTATLFNARWIFERITRGLWALFHLNCYHFYTQNRGIILVFSWTKTRIFGSRVDGKQERKKRKYASRTLRRCLLLKGDSVKVSYRVNEGFTKSRCRALQSLRKAARTAKLYVIRRIATLVNIMKHLLSSVFIKLI